MSRPVYVRAWLLTEGEVLAGGNAVVLVQRDPVTGRWSTATTGAVEPSHATLRPAAGVRRVDLARLRQVTPSRRWPRTVWVNVWLSVRPSASLATVFTLPERDETANWRMWAVLPRQPSV